MASVRSWSQWSISSHSISSRRSPSPGCALCRVLADFEEREMATFAREGRRVPEARSRFTASGGFCRRHGGCSIGSRRKPAAGCRSPTSTASGRAGSRTAAQAGRPVPEPLSAPRPCPACEAAEAALERKADFFVDALKEAAVRAAYTDSNGFCEAHLAATLAVARRSRARGRAVPPLRSPPTAGATGARSGRVRPQARSPVRARAEGGRAVLRHRCGQVVRRGVGLVDSRA